MGLLLGLCGYKTWLKSKSTSFHIVEADQGQEVDNNDLNKICSTVPTIDLAEKERLV